MRMTNLAHNDHLSVWKIEGMYSLFFDFVVIEKQDDKCIGSKFLKKRDGQSSEHLTVCVQTYTRKAERDKVFKNLNNDVIEDWLVESWDEYEWEEDEWKDEWDAEMQEEVEKEEKAIEELWKE